MLWIRRTRERAGWVAETPNVTNVAPISTVKEKEQLPFDSPPTWDFDDEYRSRRSSYDRVRDDLRVALERLLDDLRTEALFRAKVVGARVKEPDSVRRKAETKGIPADQALDALDDLVGVRIVCNNLGDVNAVVDAIQEHANIKVLDVDPVELLYHGSKGGYRGRHLTVRHQVMRGFREDTVTAEIQVRTLLPDAWAHLSHDDFYKPEETSSNWLTESMEDFSNRLHALDQQAESLRGAVQNQYVDLKRSLAEVVKVKLEQGAATGAVGAVVEALSSADQGQQLAGIEVFIGTPSLWESGLSDFVGAVTGIDSWLTDRLTNRMLELPEKEFMRLYPIIDALSEIR